MMQAAFFPEPLAAGDKVAICSPAGAVNEHLFAPAADALTAEGWRAEIMPGAMGRFGSYSGSYDTRFADIRDALLDRSVKAVICARGGYGSVHLLEQLDSLSAIWEHPKWLVGFSDISALHALWHKHGVASVHSSMLKSISKGESEQNNILFDILRGCLPQYQWADSEQDVQGECEGQLVGGNLSVLSALISTPYDLLRPDTVLFIEDINEPIYKLERMLWQLRLSGVLPSLRGLIVGDFTGTQPDANYQSAKAMVSDMVSAYGYPVVMTAPIGHGEKNMPMIEGARVRLKVDKNGSKLQFLK